MKLMLIGLNEKMLKEFVDKWEKHKDKVKLVFKEKHPEDYTAIVTEVLKAITTDSCEDGEEPDYKKIQVIDEGYYQGDLLYIIPGKSPRPKACYYVRVAYGSCTECDTLQGIRGYSDSLPTDKEIDGYMTLALHIVQELKRL